MQKARGHPKAPTACRHGFVLPPWGCFSSFSHLTGSLSVVEEYLALGWTPCSHGVHGSVLLVGWPTRHYRTVTFCIHLSRWFVSLSVGPCSLAATKGIAFASFSACLDVSVHQVRSQYLCIQYWYTQDGLPHSEIPRSKPVTGSFGLIAGYHVPIALDAKTSAMCPWAVTFRPDIVESARAFLRHAHVSPFGISKS